MVLAKTGSNGQLVCLLPSIRSILSTKGSQHFDHLAAADSQRHMDCQALTRVLVDQVQESHHPSIVRCGAGESTDVTQRA